MKSQQLALPFDSTFYEKTSDEIKKTLSKFSYPPEIIADILSLSNSTIYSRIKKKYIVLDKKGNVNLNQLLNYDIIKKMALYRCETVTPIRPFKLVELFAGGGGLAIGFEKAGFKSIFLNEFNREACQTLRTNRPEWNVVEQDITKVDFTTIKQDVDVLTGGFPCQAFSYAGKSLGFEDTRGTLFYEFARSIKVLQPKIFIGENVKGLVEHDAGKTMLVIKHVIKDLGYTLVSSEVLKAIFYSVPQKRERLFLVGIRNDIFEEFKESTLYEPPLPNPQIYTLKDALLGGTLYSSDVPESKGQLYPKRKKEIMDMVPEGGFWKHLPDEIQREYMQGSYLLGGGKTGMARRLAMNAPSLTLTCAPAQKQTERCHPLETRPLQVREYARIQTFPDDWQFKGSLTAQYKQIGNAVPVNLAYSVALSIIKALNKIEQKR